jgi:LPS-assembly lipoprotein
MTLRFRTLLILALAGSLAACGFQLRGQAPLPFASAYVDAGQGGLADRLRRQLDARQKLAPAREGAEIVVRLGQERRDKSILSLSGAGKVREYRLSHVIEMEVSRPDADPDAKPLLAPANLRTSRDFAHSDAQILAKETEEAQLNRDMEDELLNQILRRLSLVPAR